VLDAFSGQDGVVGDDYPHGITARSRWRSISSVPPSAPTRSCEDRLRAEDRAWTVKERDVEQRRAIYADLLDKARAITNDLGAMDKHGRASAGPSGDPESDELFKMGRDLVQRNLDEFRRLISRASLSAVDQQPLRRADECFAEPTALHVLLSRQRHALLDQLIGLMDLKSNLEEACRRDLDLSVADGPPRFSQLLE